MKTKNSQEAVVFMQTIYLLSTLLGSDKSLNLGQKNRKQSSPEVNSKGNCIHCICMTPNEKPSKEDSLKPKSKCIQV
jgi:hypothetical protein